MMSISAGCAGTKLTKASLVVITHAKRYERNKVRHKLSGVTCIANFPPLIWVHNFRRLIRLTIHRVRAQINIDRNGKKFKPSNCTHTHTFERPQLAISPKKPEKNMEKYKSRNN